MNMLLGFRHWFQFMRNSVDGNVSHTNRICLSFVVAMGNTFSMSTASINFPSLPTIELNHSVPAAPYSPAFPVYDVRPATIRTIQSH